MKAIRVVLADDHALVRAGIRALLEKMPAVEVVADAGSGAEALALVETHRPEVLLIDLAMPGLSGVDVAARVRDSFPDVRVMILSIHDTEEYVVQALAAGAVAYLLKHAAATQIEQALGAVMDGGMYLSPAISRRVIDDYLARVSGRAPTSQLLTRRQLQVLRLVAQGLSTKEIAFALDISAKTVEAHRAQIMERLHIHDVPGLVKYAIRSGLTGPEP